MCCSPLPPPVVMTMILLRCCGLSSRWNGAERQFFPVGKEKGKREKNEGFSIFLRHFFCCCSKHCLKASTRPRTRRAHHDERVPVRCHRHLFLSEKEKVVLKIFSSLGKYKGEGFDNTVVPRYHIPPQIKKKIEIFDTCIARAKGVVFGRRRRRGDDGDDDARDRLFGVL